MRGEEGGEERGEEGGEEGEGDVWTCEYELERERRGKRIAGCAAVGLCLLFSSAARGVLFFFFSSHLQFEREVPLQLGPHVRPVLPALHERKAHLRKHELNLLPSALAPSPQPSRNKGGVEEGLRQ